MKKINGNRMKGAGPLPECVVLTKEEIQDVPFGVSAKEPPPNIPEYEGKITWKVFEKRSPSGWVMVELTVLTGKRRFCWIVRCKGKRK